MNCHRTCKFIDYYLSSLDTSEVILNKAIKLIKKMSLLDMTIEVHLFRLMHLIYKPKSKNCTYET